ncbi:MAG: hypothetical protein WB716_02965, partial [Candidatus Acidiferrales bacterium]
PAGRDLFFPRPSNSAFLTLNKVAISCKKRHLRAFYERQFTHDIKLNLTLDIELNSRSIRGAD